MNRGNKLADTLGFCLFSLLALDSVALNGTEVAAALETGWILGPTQTLKLPPTEGGYAMASEMMVTSHPTFPGVYMF